MEIPPKKFLREHRFALCNTTKRVTKEGTGSLITDNTLIKYEVKTFLTNGTRLDLPSQNSFRVSTLQLADPSNSLPALNQALVSMYLLEEAWVSIPAGFHQESEEPWEDLIYFIRVTGLEVFELITPRNWKFLREHKLGTNKTLRKRVIAEGHGELPEINMLVTYYYTVYFPDGSEKEPYRNKSHILPKVPLQETHACIWQCLTTMREGEDCLLIVPPGGFKYNNPTELWVSIQLMYMNKPEGSLYPQELKFIREEEIGAGVLKRVLVEGEGKALSCIEKLWFKIEGWLEDSFQFQKLKNDVIHFKKEIKMHTAVQLQAMKTMKKGEVAIVKCPEGTHLYEDGLENEIVWIKYTLIDYLEETPDLTRLKDLPEKLKHGNQMKEIANRLYKSGIRSESKAIYNKINSALVLKTSILDSLEPELKEHYNTLKSSILSNLSLVHLKDAEEFKEKDLIDKNAKKVIEFASLDLDIKPNSKSYFRRSKAYTLKGEYEKAKEEINLALKIEPRNAEINEFLKTLDKKIREENQREKSVFKEVFNPNVWVKEAEADEARQQKIKEDYEYLEEREQEQEITAWLSQLGTKGVQLGGVDAMNLLINDPEDINIP